MTDTFTFAMLVEKLEMWRINLDNKGLRVIMSITKVILCGKGLDTIKTSGECPCVFCRKEKVEIQFTGKAVKHGYIRNALELKRDFLMSHA